MYEILFFMGGMGSPFREDPNDALNLLTSGNNPVRLLGDVRSVFLDIYTEPHLRDVQIGISSRTDEPDWARELLTKFKVVSLGEDINFQGRDENEESYTWKISLMGQLKSQRILRWTQTWITFVEFLLSAV